MAFISLWKLLRRHFIWTRGITVLLIFTSCETLAFEDCLRLNGSCVDQCPVGFRVFQNECLLNCPDGLHVGPDNVTCTNCSRVTIDGECLRNCPPKTYQSSSNCIPCDDLCSECIGPGEDNCTDCLSVKLNGTCVLECPPDYVVFDSECLVSCPQNTATASGNNTCLEECSESEPYKLDSICVASCEHFIHINTCVDSCPENFVVIPGNVTCLSECPESQPNHLARNCHEVCPVKFRFAHQRECLKVCPDGWKFVPGEKTCIRDCPSAQPFAFNQMCMKKCPPGTYRTLEDTGFRCLPYVGLRGMTVVIACLLVLVCVVFGIYMSKQYNIVRKTEDSVASLVSDSEKALLEDDTGRYSRSATIGLIHVHSERRSSAEQPLLSPGKDV